MSKLIINKIKSELSKIKSRYEKKYGAAIFDVKVKILDGVIALDGLVLSDKQKNEIFLAAKEIIKGGRVKNEIKALADPKEKLEIGWGIVKIKVADIWAIFPANGKISALASSSVSNLDLIESNRASQAKKGDCLRILDKKSGWLLVQLKDLTIGWIKKDRIVDENRQKAEEKWKKVLRSSPEKLIKINSLKSAKKKLNDFLKKYLHTPYLWGGTAVGGIDCSGLMQNFYLEFFGILLPRNSRDQGFSGKEIAINKLKFGDLIFLRHKTKKYSHIGIVIEEDKNADRVLALNARREDGGVIIQTFGEILKEYKVISVRRIVYGNLS